MKKSRTIFKRAAALLLCCVFLCCPVSADLPCSLRVNILDGERNPVEYFNVEICQVTSFDGTGHTLLPEYAGLGISAADLDAELSVEQAEAVYQHVYASGIVGKILTTNKHGLADFISLEKGIYLVFDRGGQFYTFPPYLVELPTQTPEGLLYHLNSEPKTISNDSRTLLVAVVWLDDENAAGKRPQNVEVTLLREAPSLMRAAPTPAAEASPYRSVVLNEACKWQHTFHMLPHTGTYSVEGSVVPEYELIDIHPVMEGFILVYEYKPSPTPPHDPTPPSKPSTPSKPKPKPKPEEEKKLPQTGFQMMPVYAMLGAGSVLVVLGMVDLCAKKEEP
ncbi:MAG: Cna B-type domain-containing protein [Oscillospiraceae bacterium]|nr:Cna B-type domain-containing protein [Oscillospiraceae bacterium]